MTCVEMEEEIGVSLRTIFGQGPSGLKLPDMVCAYETALEIQPKVLVEIGAGWGISSVILGLVAKKCGGKLYSVEYRVKEQWSKYLERYRLTDYVTMIKGRNPWLDWPSLSHIKKIDYLLIDGNHSYHPVILDYFTWAPRVRAGGRIAFHDHLNRKADVARAIKGFEEIHKLEFVKESRSSSGLYVVKKVGKGPR